MGYAAVHGRIYKTRKGDARHSNAGQHPEPVGNKNTDDDAAAEEQGGPVQADQGKSRLHNGRMRRSYNSTL